ncbi:SMP-30/gluconolactonase/LRE family protein [Stieleria sp. JC731]|uniref:SMP-30/gluconolactonase/LRE family protein n=1 Tax=Pirellulaceae TaxID=2691357 RepID=UPI001E5A0E76|nr:SMP-30/gluconolactonase/LRE family protein [Stieleria sp. JC731]MCC9599906.1 SMP-30/gluconolactonase/LRE family protein [Stieleria sp. JC731]
MTSVSRRTALANALAAFTAANLGGCVSRSESDTPELIWGRRGQANGRFLTPRAITIDRNDQLYIVDKTGRIQVFEPDGTWLRDWRTPDITNGKPTGMTIMFGDSPSDDLLLVADTHYYRMLAYTLEGERIEEREIGGTSGFGPGEFAFLTDVATDNEGCIYIGEYGDADRIQKFSPDGDFILSWGATGREPTQFLRPQGLHIDGNVMWVADSGNHRIQRFDLSGKQPELIDIWGSPGSGPGQLFYPYGVFVMPEGDAVVCEYGNGRVQHFDTKGNSIGTWGSPGLQPGQLYDPWGLVVDSKNRMHILDSNNHRVQCAAVPT